MTAEEIYKEVLTSIKLKGGCGIPNEILEIDRLDENSNIPILEYIKIIIKSAKDKKPENIYNDLIKVRTNGNIN